MTTTKPSHNAQHIQWRDLCAANRWHTALEIVRPLALLIAAAVAVAKAQIALGLVLFLFGHIAALRSAHGAVHKTLGLPRWANRYVLHGVSALLLTSCHALDFTHRLHHRRCCAPEDIEGKIAHVGFWRALLMSPKYHGVVIAAAWRSGGRGCRKNIALDLALGLVFQAGLAYLMGAEVLVLWLALIVLNGASGLLSVWLFHRGGEMTRSGHFALLNWLAMGMLYHGEHHRYPGVTTANLGKLAARLKAAQQLPPALFSDGDAHMQLFSTLEKC